MLASTSRDRNAKVWCIELGTSQRFGLQLQHTLPGHNGAVLSVRMTNTHIYTSSGDKNLRIWDKQSGELIRDLNGVASFSQMLVREGPSGTRVLGGCSDGMIRIYDAENGNQLACMEGHTNVVSSVQLLHRQRNEHLSGWIGIASASYDGTARVWVLQQEAPFGWECRDKLSLADIATPLRLTSERAITATGVKGNVQKTHRVFDAQVNNDNLYCCGEGEQIVVWHQISKTVSLSETV